MFDHTGIVVSDLERARRFYDAIAAALGLQTADNGDESFVFGKSAEEPIPYLWVGVTRPSYWAPGSRAGLNQMHIAFQAKDRAMVDAFFQAALENGGTDHGAPGPRQGAGAYYGAFVLDPDGNNIEACCRGEAAG